MLDSMFQRVTLRCSSAVATGEYGQFVAEFTGRFVRLTPRRNCHASWQNNRERDEQRPNTRNLCLWHACLGVAPPDR